MEKQKRTLNITNKRGLHARASSKFAVIANEYPDANIIVSKDDEDVSGYSIMDLMMLAAGIGSSIDVYAEGPNAETALNALEELVNNKFGEGE